MLNTCSLGAEVAGMQKIFSDRICSPENVSLFLTLLTRPCSFTATLGEFFSENSSYCCTSVTDLADV